MNQTKPGHKKTTAAPQTSVQRLFLGVISELLGECQSRIPEGEDLTLQLPWGSQHLGRPQSYNEHKQAGLIWEAEEGPEQPGQSQENVDKQQKWLEAMTSSGFPYSLLCAWWLFHPAREGDKPYT